MAAVKHFRSSFNGFNREDVVQYIEYLNNQHTAQLAQLNTQLQTALSQPKAADLQAKLDAAEARCAQLEAQLAAMQQGVPAPVSCADEELAAYRRAERAERTAKERAQQIYAQANAVLADVTVKVEAASAQMCSIADQVSSQLQVYQQSVACTKEAFRDAVSTLYAIKPEE